MRNYTLLVLLMSIVSCLSSQENYVGFKNAKHHSGVFEIQQKWRINKLISDAETKEYILTPQSPNSFENYGNNIIFNQDQTFRSSYSAPCGNDCFTSTEGKYKIIDENYMCFYLDEITQSGECSGNSKPNEDLGLFYYYKYENGFLLMKSSGSLEKDKMSAYYRDLIVKKREEIIQVEKSADIGFAMSKYNLEIFKWKQTYFKDEKKIVDFCMAENNIKKYEFLYHFKGDIYSYRDIMLVKVNNQFRYVLYDTRGEPKVCLYDDSKIKETLKKEEANYIKLTKTK
jgi:hypothetical protein